MAKLTIKIFYLYLLFIPLTSVKPSNDFSYNNNSCPESIFLEQSRQYRGINFLKDSQKWVESKREPRLFSFSTEEQDVAIRMEFGVPFITIPTKRTIDGLRSFAYNVMQGEIPKPIFNLPAFTLIGFLCLTFSTLGSVIRGINQKSYELGKAPNLFRNDDDEESELTNLWTVIDKIDKTLGKYNIDTVACVQRSICSQVRESRQNVRQKSATKWDVVIEGISRTDWMLNFIAETAIEDAINYGKQQRDCDKAFPTCTVNLQFFSSNIQNLMKKINLPL